jgi:predicted anti-sigma-YlaC factor YlaD
VSARLDGEPLGMSASVLDDHLATCADCADWAEAAARATRLVRLDTRPVPDLSAAIAAQVAVPARRVLRRRQMLRLVLFLAGAAQLAVGVPAVIGDSIGMAMSAHAAHEAAAWSIAVGVAFMAAAWVPRRAAGLIPLLTVFLVVLGALSVRDYADGAVGAARLATHFAAVVGLAVLVLLDRSERALPPGRFTAGGGADEAGGRTLRTVA